jgi:Amt family ammonium transporter
MGLKIFKKFLFLPVIILMTGALFAEEAGISVSVVGVNTLWVLISAFLVFFMQAGFGMVEAGFIRAKNASNILTKNFLDFCVACIGFFIFGYAFMYGQGNDFIGSQGWCLMGAKSSANIPLFAFWLFQAAFCGATASIVAGGMAERMKFGAYFVFSFIISSFIYPVVGHWIWGGGWLAKLNFVDFAGSTVVHIVGGFSALVGTIILKPRLGKYNPDGKPKVIAGHNIPLASLGVFILWFGWFGFNAGSTLSVGDGSLIGRIALNTNLSAVSGALSALLVIWVFFKKPDLSMMMNGSLAGLVAITASCAFVEPWAAILIGAIAGILVVVSVVLLDKLQIDDPVGAVPVHAVNGLFGTLALGIFGQKALGLANDGLAYGGGWTQFGIQAMGASVVIIFVVISMTIIFKLIDTVIGLRVSKESERKGLDIGEHGMESYDGFQIFSNE